MGFFSGLGERLQHIFSKIANKGKLTELEIKQTMREIRIALLEADVNFNVVKDFINSVSQKALGQEILGSLTASQQVVKIVNEELTALMGSAHSKLNLSGSPAIIMLCGLQGAGKTTMCGKLAAHLKKQGRKPLLAACDIYRPAAIKQLAIVAKTAGVEFYGDEASKNAVKIAQAAIKSADKLNCDTVILDTAGRLHINEELMKELADIKRALKPCEILLTVDAMTGQDAVNVAAAFNQKLDISGVILTKLDGDTRGGAALSIKAVTGKPIKFCGTGEKTADLEIFYPDRMASRILGMGDVLTLIEKAQAGFEKEQLEKMEKRLRSATFTLDDFLTQLEAISKMGGITDMLAMLPGKFKINADDIDEQNIMRTKAIIHSMTPAERENPDIIKASRRKRIADGSGTTVSDVNKLLKQFDQLKDMMKQFSGKRGFLGKKGLPF